MPALGVAPYVEPEIPAADVEQLVEVQPVPSPPPKIWEGSFEMGLDGTTGNTETFNLRFGFNAKRKGQLAILSLDLDYNKKTDHGEETANRAYLDWRAERIFGDSPWTTFFHGTVDYDEFKPFDLRVTADTGFGYKVIDRGCTTLTARAGAGFSREIGGPNDEYVPEAVFGLALEHKLNDFHKISATSEYMPEMEDTSDFRINTQANWEILISQVMNLSLKLSVLDRYDSTPEGAEPNDLDYSGVLLWKF